MSNAGSQAVCACHLGFPYAEAHSEATLLVDSFSFLAVMTSFIGFFLGLSDFFKDLLPLPEQGPAAKMPAYALAAVPPYLIAIAFPDIFMAALDKVRNICECLQKQLKNVLTKHKCCNWSAVTGAVRQ